jgi:hypothetical protein
MKIYIDLEKIDLIIQWSNITMVLCFCVDAFQIKI